MKNSKYQLIKSDILKRIINGEFSDGKLPPMPKLAEDYQVSLLTARKAVKDLELQGAVSCQTGNVGTLIDRSRAEALGNAEEQHLMVGQGFTIGRKVVVRFLFSSFYLAVMEKVKKLFSDRYPWAEIELIPAVNVHQLLADGIGFDTVMLTGRDVADYAETGRLRDLTPFGDPDAKTFLGTVWKHRNRYSFPFNWSVPLLYARPELPEIRSWHDFSAAMNHTSMKNLKPGLYLGFYSLFFSFLGNIKTRFPEHKVDSMLPEMLLLLNKLCTKDMMDSYHWNNQNALKAGLGDEFGMLCGYFSSLQNYIKTNSHSWRVSRMPLSRNGTPVIATDTLSLGTDSSCPREAWLWIRFLLRADIQHLFAELPSFLSVRADIFREQELGPGIHDILEEEARNAIQPDLSSRSLYMLYSSIFPLLEQYFAGKMPLEKLVPEVKTLLEEISSLDHIY